MLILASNKLAASRQVVIAFSREGDYVGCKASQRKKKNVRFKDWARAGVFKPVLHNLHKPDCGENKLIVNTMQFTFPPIWFGLVCASPV
uniref:Uncharacterized protein n=1 Tax=Setaria italica TaxID=4555 RepID=K3XTM9_SETIT